MANEKNLIPGNKRSQSENRENGKKGGKASGRARREKATVQKLMNDVFNAPCSKYKGFNELAAQLGLESKESVKKVFILACTQKAIKRADLDTIKTLCELLGEPLKPEQKSTPFIEELAESLFKDEVD